MDARTERDLFDRIASLAGLRSVVLISHRLAAVRSADRIYMLDDGRVVESGTHDELVAQNGQYAQLFALQAQGYHDTSP